MCCAEPIPPGVHAPDCPLHSAAASSSSTSPVGEPPQKKRRLETSAGAASVGAQPPPPDAAHTVSRCGGFLPDRFALILCPWRLVSDLVRLPLQLRRPQRRSDPVRCLHPSKNVSRWSHPRTNRLLARSANAPKLKSPVRLLSPLLLLGMSSVFDFV